MKFILEGGKMIAANTAGYIGEKAKEGSFWFWCKYIGIWKKNKRFLMEWDFML